MCEGIGGKCLAFSRNNSKARAASCRTVMGMVGEQQAVCSVLELKCSQVCRKVDESRLSDTHTVNEGQAGTVQAKKKKNGGRRDTKKGDEHMQKAGENDSHGYKIRNSDDDDNDDKITIMVVIQDEKSS